MARLGDVAIRKIADTGQAMKINRYKIIFREVMNDESGQDLIEYALVAALIGLGAVVSMRSLSTRIGTAFTTIGTSVTTDI